MVPLFSVEYVVAGRNHVFSKILKCAALTGSHVPGDDTLLGGFLATATFASAVSRTIGTALFGWETCRMRIHSAGAVQLQWD